MHKKIIHCTCSDNVLKPYTAFFLRRWHLYEWSCCSWVSAHNHTFSLHAHTHEEHLHAFRVMRWKSCSDFVHKLTDRSDVRGAPVELSVYCKKQKKKHCNHLQVQSKLIRSHVFRFGPRSLRLNSGFVCNIWTVKLLLIWLPRKRGPIKIYSWPKHSCQTCLGFSRGGASTECRRVRATQMETFSRNHRSAEECGSRFDFIIPHLANYTTSPYQTLNCMLNSCCCLLSI